MYNKYNISPDDKFIIEEYPEIANEMSILNLRIKNLPENYCPDILISFLKEHKIKKTWIAANPELVKTITSSKYATGNMESLFESCKKIKTFLAEYEHYIRSSIKRDQIF